MSDRGPFDPALGYFDFWGCWHPWLTRPGGPYQEDHFGFPNTFSPYPPYQGYSASNGHNGLDPGLEARPYDATTFANYANHGTVAPSYLGFSYDTFNHHNFEYNPQTPQNHVVDQPVDSPHYVSIDLELRGPYTAPANLRAEDDISRSKTT